MAVDLRCPNCGENLGKDKENTVDAHCGNCGEEFFNDRGYTYDQAHYEHCKKKFPKNHIPKPDNDEN